MINVDKKKGFCELCGTGLELATVFANIAAGFCESAIEGREPGTSKHEAMKYASMLLRTALEVGIGDAQAAAEDSVPDEEDPDDAE